jgi:ABC-type uncharacterized transport system ATPase subunit
MSLIEVKNLSKTFKKPIRGEGLKGMFKTLFSRKYEEIKAVDNISFNIESGEIVGYIGANGAGKSTTIKMMCGILYPSSGKVVIDGKTYYFGTKGARTTGWVKHKNNKYYFNKKNGTMVKGWKKIDNKYYYFSTSNGKMQKNKWIGKYYVNSKGVRTKKR